MQRTTKVFFEVLGCARRAFIGLTAALLLFRHLVLHFLAEVIADQWGDADKREFHASHAGGGDGDTLARDNFYLG